LGLKIPEKKKHNRRKQKRKKEGGKKERREEKRGKYRRKVGDDLKAVAPAGLTGARQGRKKGKTEKGKQIKPPAKPTPAEPFHVPRSKGIKKQRGSRR